VSTIPESFKHGKGHVANPHGYNGRIMTWAADYAPRMHQILSDYSEEEIKAFGKNIKLRAKHFTAWDSILILQLADVFEKNSKERMAFFDRLLGKAVQTVNSNVQVTHSAPIVEIDDMALVRLADAIAAARMPAIGQEKTPVTIEGNGGEEANES